MPRLSIVTTCKGRLQHLRQSLPSFLVQPETEVIVVDYDCPEGTAGVVAREFPAANVVHEINAPHFNLSRARNLGAAAATADWIAFVDADVVLAPDFFTGIAPKLDEMRGFYHFYPMTRETVSASGTCLVRRTDFDAIGGYDEIMEGYGCEDADFYFRLVLYGLKRLPLNIKALVSRIILHEDATRVQFGAYRTMGRHQRINAAYHLVKNSLLRQLGHGGLSREQQVKIFDLVRGIVEEANKTPDQPIHFQIELPEDIHFMPTAGWDCKRFLQFELAPTIHPDADQRLDDGNSRFNPSKPA